MTLIIESSHSNRSAAFSLFVLLLVLNLPSALGAQDTTYFSFGGYMRSGFGADGKGGPHDVFKAPDSESKYRLGNEAEAYVEALFKYSFEDDRSSLFETNLRLAFVTPTSKSNEFAFNKTTLDLSGFKGDSVVTLDGTTVIGSSTGWSAGPLIISVVTFPWWAN